MGFWTTFKMVPLYTAGKTFAFANACNINMVSHHKGLDRHSVTFLEFRLSHPELTQKAQRG
jgi:hypothetical protein